MHDKVICPEEFWKAAETIGLKRSQILFQAKLPLSLAAEKATMTTDQAFELWRAIETLAGPDAAHAMTLGTNKGALPPNFIVAFHSRNFGDAVHRIARYKSVSASVTFDLASIGDEFVVTLSWPSATTSVPNGLVDSTFTFLVLVARECTGTHVVPKRVELAREPSQKLRDWYGCPIRWGAESARLVFKQSDLGVPFVQYNRELIDLLEDVLDQRLMEKSGRGRPYHQQVRWHLTRRLTGGKPDLAGVAEDMAVSGRSLQRHLRHEGFSFQKILSDTRRDLAREYLAQPGYDYPEIAFLLGYESQSSFSRAFQRWENQTPSEWREAHLDKNDT